MTGKEFLRLVARRGIPLSCIASRLNCKLATIRAFELMDTIPKPYVIKFISAFQDSLSPQDLDLLTQ
ncbi:hypothetical protein [Glaciecola petra]|uniref:XRE family transcriptional regulator n=1 Tax=Glaciecola petra TaxID=3075602 RepID=A0ABU2ZNN5_9ALTE|nr:hypothetical protein [Aestuariibacter sp. P117]MDT0594243.1 hypothetical protein [Aestuariibacter sp. P117]